MVARPVCTVPRKVPSVLAGANFGGTAVIAAAVMLGFISFACAAPSSGAPAAPRSPTAANAPPSNLPDDAALAILPPTFVPPPLVPPRSDTGVAHPAPSTSLEELAAMLSKTPEVIVADVAGSPITLGMVAEGVRSLPPMWG